MTIYKSEGDFVVAHEHDTICSIVTVRIRTNSEKEAVNIYNYRASKEKVMADLRKTERNMSEIISAMLFDVDIAKYNNGKYISFEDIIKRAKFLSKAEVAMRKLIDENR